jgi:hypothetical protein
VFIRFCKYKWTLAINFVTPQHTADGAAECFMPACFGLPDADDEIYNSAAEGALNAYICVRCNDSIATPGVWAQARAAF